jgi:hypothetical protein
MKSKRIDKMGEIWGVVSTQLINRILSMALILSLEK